jgi:predicted nuclease with TOPRIM domain
MSKDKLRELLSQLWLQDISADEAFDELEDLINRITQLEQENDALKQRIKRLEDIISRASSRFFRDGSNGMVAIGMLNILEEVRKP